MSDIALYKGPPRTLSEIANPVPFVAIAAVALVVGFWWLPAWFLAAQLIRVWAQSGGVRWLSSRGVAEYTDERYATIIGNALLFLIAFRLLLAINWLESFQILVDEHRGWAMNADPQQVTYVAVILGLAIAISLTGVMKTKRLPWVFATAGFALVLGLALVADGRVWLPTTVEAVPLIALGYLVSRIPMFFDRRLDRRAAKRAEAELEANRARA